MVKGKVVDGVLRWYDDNGVEIPADQLVVNTVKLTREINKQQLKEKMVAAIQANKTYINLVSTTAAQDKAQLKNLSRQMNAIWRLVVESYDDITGT